MFNDYLINPSIAGSKDYIPISLSVRSQWSGFQDAPNTQFFSAHSKLGKKLGVGGYVFNDETGPISQNGIQLSYAYHIQILENSKLSFGLAGMLFSHHINSAKLKFDQPSDAAVNNLVENSVVPDVNFGMLYYTDKYKIGIAVPQIFQNNIYDNAVTGNKNKLVRHYFLHGEYSFVLNDKIDIVPSTLLKFVDGAPFQFDINVKGVYQKKYWLGFSYRNSTAAVGMIGLAYQQFRFGYSYDYILTDIGNYSSGTHEIYLGLILGKKDKVSSAKFQ